MLRTIELLRVAALRQDLDCGLVAAYAPVRLHNRYELKNFAPQIR